MKIKEIINAVEGGNKENKTIQAFIKSVSVETKKGGGDYLIITLSDDTGEALVKKWDIVQGDMDRFSVGKVVELREVTAKIYNNNYDLTFSSRSVITDMTDAVLSDYILTFTKTQNELKKMLRVHLDSIKTESLKNLVSSLFKGIAESDRFFNWPAAEAMHHSDQYGLLCHTVGVLTTSEAIYNAMKDVYLWNDANLDIIKAAAFCHDFFKIKEYEASPTNGYKAKLGNEALIPHIILASEYIHDCFRDGVITEDIERRLKHCVIAHHGKYEYGSPAVPMTTEALILHLGDYADSRIYMMLQEAQKLSDNEIMKKGSFGLDKARVVRMPIIE